MDFNKGDKAKIKRNSNVIAFLRNAEVEVLGDTTDDDLVFCKILSVDEDMKPLPQQVKRLVNKDKVKINVHNLELIEED